MENLYKPDPLVAQAVKELKVQEHASMTVERFRDRWLSRFLDPDPELEADWYREVTNNIYRRVDLTHRGEKVGEVPGFAVKTSLATTQSDHPAQSTAERLMRLNNQIKRLPQASDRLIRDLTNDLVPDSNIQVKEERLAEWRQLYALFGETLPGEKDAPADPENPSEPQETIDQKDDGGLSMDSFTEL